MIGSLTILVSAVEIASAAAFTLASIPASSNLRILVVAGPNCLDLLDLACTGDDRVSVFSGFGSTDEIVFARVKELISTEWILALRAGDELDAAHVPCLEMLVRDGEAEAYQTVLESGSEFSVHLALWRHRPGGAFSDDLLRRHLDSDARIEAPSIDRVCVTIRRSAFPDSETASEGAGRTDSGLVGNPRVSASKNRRSLHPYAQPFVDNGSLFVSSRVFALLLERVSRKGFRPIGNPIEVSEELARSFDASPDAFEWHRPGQPLSLVKYDTRKFVETLHSLGMQMTPFRSMSSGHGETAYTYVECPLSQPKAIDAIAPFIEGHNISVSWDKMPGFVELKRC